jgi:hypothetical protein
MLSAAGVSVFLACGSESGTPFTDDGGDPVQTDDASSSGSSSGSGSSGSGSSSGGLFFDDGGVVDAAILSQACKAGRYEGTFDGSYTSSLTILGFPLSVSGNVDLTLNQEGGDAQVCTVGGEFTSCSNVFTLENGTITGVANKAGTIGDAAVGGFPYFCVMTGTLDCSKKRLVGGWIQCTYCAFDNLTEGGTQCDGANVGGHFAGPLTANYDPNSHTFVNGTWNGAEALAGNDGAAPGPEGGTINDYLSLDGGGYGFLGKFGGNGTWNATLQP